MCYLHQKIAPEVSPDVLIAANPGFPARNWNPAWKCWSMFWAFWGKILILNSVARPLWPKAYPDILEERLICCVVFRQRSLIRTHRELGKSSPEEDRCTSLLVPHITDSCGFFFAKMSQQSQTTKPTCSLTNILDLSWLPLGRKGHQRINWWRRLGSFRWLLILRRLLTWAFSGYFSLETDLFHFWLHLLCFAGDLGRVDEDGFFYVCGRIKELIVTAGGRFPIFNPTTTCCLLKHIKYNIVTFKSCSG